MHKGERIGHTPRLLLKELHMLHCYANFLCCLLTAPPPSTPLHCPNLHDLDYSMGAENHRFHSQFQNVINPMREACC